MPSRAQSERACELHSAGWPASSPWQPAARPPDGVSAVRGGRRWLTHVQGEPVLDYFSAVNRVNKARR
jgi:hypothetical protein